MNRNDTYGYHRNKLDQAEQDIRNHSSRIELLEDPGNALLQNLWHDERHALIDYHQQGIIKSVMRAVDADNWLKAQTTPGLDPDLFNTMVERLADLLLGELIPLAIESEGEVILPANKVITKTMLAAVVNAWHRQTFFMDASPVRNRILQTLESTKP